MPINNAFMDIMIILGVGVCVGDVIAVTGEMDSDGFYMGIFEGRKGLVPSKFLEEMEVADKEAQQRLLNQVCEREGGRERERGGGAGERERGGGGREKERERE